MTLDLDCDELQEQVEEFLPHAANASQPRGIKANTYLKYGTFQLMMQVEPLTPQPRHLSIPRTQHYPATMKQMTTY